MFIERHVQLSKAFEDSTHHQTSETVVRLGFEYIFRRACDFVDPSELFELLARFPEDAEDFTVETELVDSSRITIGAEQNLVRRRSNADCPRRSRSLRLVAQDRRIGFVADRGSCIHIEWHIDRNLAQELSLNVEHLNPTVSSVSNVDVISASTAMLCGVINWPGPLPGSPQ